ncbi:MAG: hypothetical protein Q4G71_09970 [Pseudomonadota bacterium]|nr:hypothetical protein [Pseudomonadota bacterium]
MPAATVAITGGTWLTADGGSACVDGSPTRVARYQAAGAVTVTLSLASSIAVRIAAILGLRGVAVGAAVSITAGGQSANGTVQRFPDGSLGCWIVMDAVAAASVAFTLPAGTVDVGELVAMPAVDVPHEADWSLETIDPTELLRTRSGGAAITRCRGYRVLQVRLVPEQVDQVRRGGLGGDMDWDALAAAMAGGQRIAGIVRQTPENDRQRTAIYGQGRMTPISHISGDWYGAALTLEELPAAV